VILMRSTYGELDLASPSQAPSGAAPIVWRRVQSRTSTARGSTAVPAGVMDSR